MPKNEEEPFMAGTMASADAAVKRQPTAWSTVAHAPETAELMIFNILVLSVSGF